MKNEIFDEVLKRKIEAHEMHATDQEIDKVHGFVRKNLVSSKQSYKWIRLVAATTAVALISTLIFWTIQQQNVNEKLLVAVNGLQNELNRTNQIIAQNQLENKKQIQNIQKQNQQQIAQLQSKINRTELSTNGNFNAGKNGLDYNSMNGTKSSYFLNKSGVRIAGLGNKSSNREKIGIQIVPQKEIQIKESNLSNEVAPKQITPENNQVLAKTENELNLILKDSVLTVNNEKEPLDKAVHNQSDTIEIEKVVVPEAKPFDFLKSFKYRVGLNGEFAPDQTGIGILGELLFNRHWSLALGIKKGMISSDRFKDDNEYFMHKSRDFRSEYASNYTSATDISNIEFQYALMQLPLSLNFRFPLKKNFNFVGSLGSDLDLTVRQMVKYESKNTSEMPKTNSTESIRQGMILNNGILSFGVEAQFKKHFVAQVSPYLLTAFKLSEYRTDPFAAGIKFRLSYQF